MTRDEYGEAIKHWLLNGPREEDGTIGYIIGNWLWWRIWATSVLVGLPLICGFFALDQYGGATAVMVTTVVGWLASNKATEISPKYDVTKNY